MGRASQFYKLINELVSNNNHVVSFDGPAHGASSGRQTNLYEFSDAINIIAEKYGKIELAIGHSFGGITILNAIEKGLGIDNVVFVATPSLSGDIIKQFEEKINGTPATGENFRKEIFSRHGIDFDSMAASEVIQKISINSLLLVHDENDRDVPITHARVMQERYPAAKTFYTDGLGHTRILRNDKVLNEIVLHASNVILGSPNNS